MALECNPSDCVVYVFFLFKSQLIWLHTLNIRHFSCLLFSRCFWMPKQHDFCVCVCVMGMPFRSFALCYCCCSRCCHQPDEEIVHNKSACKKSNVKNHMYNSEIGLLKFNIFRSFMFTVCMRKKTSPTEPFLQIALDGCCFILSRPYAFAYAFFFSFYLSIFHIVSQLHHTLQCCAAHATTTQHQTNGEDVKTKKKN